MKNRINKLTVMLAMAGAISMNAGTAAAAEKNSVADLNGDGMVSSQELISFVEMHFLKMDKDNDQMLDAHEAAELDELFDIDG